MDPDAKEKSSGLQRRNFYPICLTILWSFSSFFFLVVTAYIYAQVIKLGRAFSEDIASRRGIIGHSGTNQNLANINLLMPVWACKHIFTDHKNIRIDATKIKESLNYEPYSSNRREKKMLKLFALHFILKPNQIQMSWNDLTSVCFCVRLGDWTRGLIGYWSQSTTKPGLFVKFSWIFSFLSIFYICFVSLKAWIPH